MNEAFFDTIALITSVVLPIFNLPLIVRILRRKSSDDISLLWAVGVWVCFLLMLPSALMSTDEVWRIFSIMNISMFSIVVFFVLKYRGNKQNVFKKN